MKEAGQVANASPIFVFILVALPGRNMWKK